MSVRHPICRENPHKKSADRLLQSLSADGNMPQITEGGMEYGVCFFDVGNNVAGRNRPSNAGTEAVYTAAIRCTGNHGVSSVVSDAHGLGGLHLLCAGGTCGTVLGGVPDSQGEGVDWVK